MNRHISSAANPLLKQARALETRRGRSKSGLFLAEGARHVAEGLDKGWQLYAIIAAESAEGRDIVRQLLRRAEQLGADAVTVPDHLLTSLTKRENAQAIIGLFYQRNLGLDDLTMPASSTQNDACFWIGLERPRDPGNLGTIIRTADSTGCNGVILLAESCDPYSHEAVRASMGSIFSVPVVRAEVDEFFSWGKTHDIKIIGTSLEGSVRHIDTDFSGATCLLMGNEQSGLPPVMANACKSLVRLPMAGGADSLNLAIATAICVYEAWRQRGFNGARF